MTADTGRSARPRPHTEIVLAMSVDGHIADAGRTPTRLGSQADRDHLDQRLAVADAVLFGATTLRSVGYGMHVISPQLSETRVQAGLPPQPIQIIASKSGRLDSELPFFAQTTTRWLATTPAGRARWTDREQFSKVVVTGDDEKGIDWCEFMARLVSLGVRRLCVLGGGDLVASIVQADVVDELWLTLCPVVIGGADAPTPIDGPGLSLGAMPPVRLRSVDHTGDEIFLRYEFN